LWVDITYTLPDASSAHALLAHAVQCDKRDLAAVKRLCVPWVTDPASMLSSETPSVRNNVSKLVAAYLLAVGASLAKCAIPARHVAALHLPRWCRMLRFCKENLSDPCDSDSDEEVMLRDDIPTLLWLDEAVEDAPAPVPPPSPPAHPPVSAPSRVHEAEALHEYG
jgi:hypothetical protein